ncbi:hypothetical protein NE237_003339 [Protea cynaroides]|uniref:Ubiquitin thioesterase OTU n=1 Tax=Protea cynaroides TaxID=273540 RepID=A0A9Q0QSC1_9MAGN|nr:hypothetical protein NE237_003339 [Protea cynaroides]
MTYLGTSSPFQNISLRLLGPKQEMYTKVRWNFRPTSLLRGGASAGLIFGLLICVASFNPVYAEVAKRKNYEEDDCESSTTSSHGKKVYTDYSITGIPGDGRCLFRSVAHGACLRSGKSSPSESLQRELADELRARVADEFVKRREETEWFVEGDFDTYVSQIRKPSVWGGEPELLMASHVLQMPITVYMHDEDAGGLIVIAEYGQEYGGCWGIRKLKKRHGHGDRNIFKGYERRKKVILGENLILQANFREDLSLISDNCKGSLQDKLFTHHLMVWCSPSTPKSLAPTIGCFATGASLFVLGAYLSFVNIAPQQARIKARNDFVRERLKKKSGK